MSGVRFMGSPLTRVMNELGREVLGGMTISPGLTAAIDQHAAAVRDAVSGRGGRVDREVLVDYLLGILDSTYGGEWADTQFQLGYSWPTLRMAAVCWLARQQGYVG